MYYFDVFVIIKKFPTMHCLIWQPAFELQKKSVMDGIRCVNHKE